MPPSLLGPAGEGKARIGARLRAARLARGMTLDQVATATALTKGFLSRVERDASSPSVATLLSLCDVLDLDARALFEPPNTPVVRRGDQPMVTSEPERVVEHLLTPRRQRHLQVTHGTVEPGASSGAKLYTMGCQVEVAYVLAGTLEVVFAAEVTRLHAGEALTFRGQEPHTWRNPDPREVAEVIWVMVPAPWSSLNGDT